MKWIEMIETTISVRHWKLIGRSAAVVAKLLTAALVLLCTPASASAVDPLSAVVPTTVEVPLALRDPPFDRDRALGVPPGFKISIVARIPGARFIMPLLTGEILVAQPSLGSILLVRPQVDGTASVSTLVEELQNPQGMALHSSGDKMYLYVGESNQICRFLIAPGAASAGEKTVIVPNLPDSSSLELRGAYRHELKNIVIGPDDKLYVDIASSTNSDPIDTTTNPVRCAIYQYDLDGSNGKIFARGIRNAEGLAFVPGTMSFGLRSTKPTTFCIRSTTAGKSADRMTSGEISPATLTTIRLTNSFTSRKVRITVGHSLIRIQTHQMGSTTCL
jgi:glucose/arabinose dehydrogenase